MFQACAVVNGWTGGMFLRTTQDGECVFFLVPRLTPGERPSSLLWSVVLRAVARDALCLSCSSQLRVVFRSLCSGLVVRRAGSFVEHISPARAGYAASAPLVEDIAPAPMASHVAHAPTLFPAPAPVVENISPAPAVHAAPTCIMEYIAPAAAGYAGTAPDEEKYVISLTRLEEVNHAALTIQQGWRWTRKRIVLRAASEERLQEKLREVWRRLVACLAVGASAKEKTESLRDMQSTLNAVEKDWRMIFNEELVNLELDLGVRSRRVEW